MLTTKPPGPSSCASKPVSRACSSCRDRVRGRGPCSCIQCPVPFKESFLPLGTHEYAKSLVWASTWLNQIPPNRVGRWGSGLQCLAQ